VFWFFTVVRVFPVLDHGLVSNMQGAALVGRDLSVDWLVLPRFDSSPLMLRLLDPARGGYWRITFEGSFSVNSRRYLNLAPIIESAVSVGGYDARVIDFMPIGIPALGRYVNAPEVVRYTMEVRPRFNYGAVEPYVEGGGDDLVFLNPLNNEALELLVIEGSCNAGADGFVSCAGKSLVLLVYWPDKRLSVLLNRDVRITTYGAFKDLLNKTIKFWSTLNRGVVLNPRDETLDMVYKSSITVLLSLIYRNSGGIVSAPTTSLPEIIGEGRNWDYRFVWVRDAAIAAEALLEANLISASRSILNFLVNIANMVGKPFNYSVYTVDGAQPFNENEIPWLMGYQNSKPVRVGNAATTQLQLDLEGWFLNALYKYFTVTHDINFLSDAWPVVETSAEWCSRNYTLQDAGLWEQRDRYRHYTHSKVMMWVCLDRAARLARDMGYKELSEEWTAKAEEVRKYILDNQDLIFTTSFEEKYVDASLLTLPLYGFIDAKDEKFLRTLDMIERELVRDGWCFRYKSDFLGVARHPFVLATEWLGMVYALLGRREDAMGVLRMIANCANDLGLLGEHVDVDTCEPRGNYPHVFSHAGYILLYNMVFGFYNST